MGHLLAREQWSDPPRALAYFCSVLRDLSDVDPAELAYAERHQEAVRRNAIQFLTRDIRHLWPGAVDAEGAFRWDLLAGPDGESALVGTARFRTQYWTANVNPSDRYTLALPGSSRYRISPLDPTYDNLTVCGDWTDCGFNGGCVEAAVMSGQLAAQRPLAPTRARGHRRLRSPLSHDRNSHAHAASRFRASSRSGAVPSLGNASCTA